ncbi:hypothetical protein LEP1GSC162_0098 [Leptospira santarosai str. CBC1531]|nr:hypothetical protein LEP1GSC162_0098 [Leptospira santarosai str. CBC1531]
MSFNLIEAASAFFNASSLFSWAWIAFNILELHGKMFWKFS